MTAGRSAHPSRCAFDRTILLSAVPAPSTLPSGEKAMEGRRAVLTRSRSPGWSPGRGQLGRRNEHAVGPPVAQTAGEHLPRRPGWFAIAHFAPGGELVIDNEWHTPLWPTGLQTWIRFACQVASRDLTRAKWADLLPDRPFQHVCPA
jgi:hypothetical protein